MDQSHVPYEYIDENGNKCIYEAPIKPPSFADLQAENLALRQAVVIACGSGKFSRPEKAAAKIIEAALASNSAPQPNMTTASTP